MGEYNIPAFHSTISQKCVTVKNTQATIKRTLDFSNALVYNQSRSESDTKSDLPSVK